MVTDHIYMEYILPQGLNMRRSWTSCARFEHQMCHYKTYRCYRL